MRGGFPTAEIGARTWQEERTMTDFDWAILADDSQGSQSLIRPTRRIMGALSR
jgi:hypothetical protein